MADRLRQLYHRHDWCEYFLSVCLSIFYSRPILWTSVWNKINVCMYVCMLKIEFSVCNGTVTKSSSDEDCDESRVNATLVTSSTGVLSSHLSPSRCPWLIRVRQHQHINITITDFHAGKQHTPVAFASVDLCRIYKSQCDWYTESILSAKLSICCINTFPFYNICPYTFTLQII